jgi:hypothetical protein
LIVPILRLFCFLVIAAVSVPSNASASSENRIALVGLASNSTLTRQLNAELRTLDFQVVLARETVSTWRELWELARRLEVAAAVWITGADQPVMEIWVVDLVTGKTVQRSIEQSGTGGGAASRVLAMRVIELLRASFREIANAANPPREGEVRPSDAVRAMAASGNSAARGRARQPGQTEGNRRRQKLSLTVGPSLAISTGGIKPFLQADLGLNWLFHRPWGVSGVLRAPIMGASVHNRDGSADLFPTSLEIEPYYSLLAQSAPWQSEIGVGFAWLGLLMRGKADEPLQGKNAFATSIALLGRASLIYQMTAGLAIRLDLQGSSAPTPIAVRFAGRNQATWGKLAGLSMVALQADL